MRIILRSSEKFLGGGKGVSASAGAGAGEPLKHELSMEPASRNIMIWSVETIRGRINKTVSRTEKKEMLV